MNKTTSNDQEQRLPGMPGPKPENLQSYQAVQNALRDLHSALLPLLDQLRPQQQAQLTFQRTINGDTLRIQVKPAREE